ncbi:DNA repair protein RecO [Chloroflexota bacterium]
MPSPRNYQTEAIITRKTKLGEADTILTLYTPHLGKIQGFAKSLRKPKSKLAGHLELLTHSMVSLVRGRNLDTITGSQTISSFLSIKDDLWLTSCALYVVELVNQFTAEHIENYQLFQLLRETLAQLPQAGNKELVLRYFELQLLEKSGYRPQLQECVSCHRALEPTTNYFSPSAGGVLCPDCRATQFAIYPLSVNVQKILRLLQNCDFATVNRIKIDDELSLQLEKVLSEYVKFLLEKEVKSADWLKNLRNQRLSLDPSALPQP